MGKKRKSGSKKADKHIVMTQARAKELQNQTYWQILEVFLLAAAELHGWGEAEVLEFSAKVNWYFQAANIDKTLERSFVHKVISEKMGLIMNQTQSFRDRLEVDLVPPKEKPKPLKAYAVYAPTEYMTVCYANNPNQARSLARRGSLNAFSYTELKALRKPELDYIAKAVKDPREMDDTSEKEIKAFYSLFNVYGE